MFLKELELVGFKSFPERTRFKFDPGITAIVGPNGCGKSNIFDGIRWVLGEQSTKALRSIKMEDIIFNGTDNKTSLGMAEVTLVFSNKNRRLSIDSDEIEISRRIFRSGESQYLLNKAPVRLRDVLDLLMGTGIGAESYSLIEQGKIDLILSNRPEERRIVFDEASGITKYNTQKREALRKLEETEQNLLRVEDIITEVRREINSLERQANKARRYKETFQELKNKESDLARLEVVDIEQQKQDLINKINASQENINSCEWKAQGVQKEISTRLARIQQIEAEIANYHDQLININNLVNNNIRHTEINTERIEELQSRISRLGDQLKEAKERIETTKINLENFHKEYNELKEAVQQRQALLTKRQDEYEQASTSIKSEQTKIKEAKNQILNLTAVSSQIKNEITGLQAQLKGQILRQKRLDVERTETQEERNKLSQVLTEETNQLNSIKSEFKRIDDQRDQVKEKLKYEINNEERLSKDLQDCDNEKIALESQREFLEELKLKYEGIKQTLNAVLYLDHAPGKDTSGIVVRINESPSKIKEKILIHDSNLRFKLKGQAKPMPLETETITQKIEQIKSVIHQKQEDQKQIQQRIDGLRENLQNLDQMAKKQEILISNKSIQVDNLTDQLNRVNQEYEIVSIEFEDLGKQIQQLNNKQSQLETSLSEADKQHKKQEEMINALDDSILDLSSLREKTLIDITQLKADIENQDAHLTQQEKTKRFLENANAQSQKLYQGYLDEVKQSESKIKQLSNEIERLKKENHKANEDRIKLDKEQAKQQVEFEQLNGLQQRDNHQALTFSQDIEKIRKQIYEYQMQMKEFDFKQRSIRDRIIQVYKIDLETASEINVGDSQDKDRQALSEEISKIKQKIDSLGTVNLIAIEEYEELKKRYDFLIRQQNDLNGAKNSLRNAINKISRTTRQMFLDTFKKIQVEFQSYFRMLFGGGQAQIMLIDESDPLESGIEIICQPPGKKLQNVLALSGGEKAMSAVALMFSILKVNPAPFCVLDEIDAALDEANISRFSGILQEFARRSQFLVITHNKRTIANADAMYGITMQESGTSKIVSVKFS